MSHDRPSHERFDDRVGDYAAARPGYPAALIAFLTAQVPPDRLARVADVGAGTGLLTRDLLMADYQVVAVEPSAAMLNVAEDNYAKEDGFSSALAPAEQLPIADATIDLITAAQAFHWFDVARCRVEWRRVLRETGRVALIWNEYDLKLPMMRELDEIVVRHSMDATHGRRREVARTCGETLWAGVPIEIHRFPHVQRLTRPLLLQRAASASYLPRPGDSRHGALVDDLNEWFDRHSDDVGMLSFHYTTELYFGPRP